MAVTGAILGDISGSQFEFHKPEHLDYKNCPLFTEQCEFTDDTVMTLAIKEAILENQDLTETMRRLGRHYPDCGYGGRFYEWIMGHGTSQPYFSYGNGSAMRVSFVGEYYDDPAQVIREAERTAAVSHNHPEGVKGAVTTAVCIWMARHGKSREEILAYVLEQYPADRYDFSADKDMDYLEKHYSWDVTCMTSVPVAMRCFYESDSFETFMRNIFRLDCDSDTLGAIGGAVAEEYYHGTGLDAEEILKKYLDHRMYLIWKR